MISGKTAYGSINGNAIAGTHKVNVEETGVELDNATSASQGCEDPEIGLTGLICNVEGWFDVGLSTIAPMRVGSSVTDLKIYVTDTAAEAGLLAHVPTGIVTRLTVGAEIRGKIDFSATIKSKRAYTLNNPSG